MRHVAGDWTAGSWWRMPDDSEHLGHAVAPTGGWLGLPEAARAATQEAEERLAEIVE